MASPSPNLPPTPIPSSLPPFEDIIDSESALLKHVSRTYAHTSFDTFSSSGYIDFAYTIENMRWAAFGQEDCEPLPRREMDRLWINTVMEFWVKMEWCWEGDVEGIVIALLQREDGPGVEEMWEERKMDYPQLDTGLCYPMIGHKGIFEDYLDLGIRAVINPEIRCYLEKLEDGTNYDSESELGEAVYSLDLEALSDEEDAEVDDGTKFLKDLDAAIEKVAKMEGEGYEDSGDEHMEWNGIEIKKEDEDDEGTLYGIEEAVPNLRLTGSGNKDDVDKEVVDDKHVDIKQEDIKPEKDVKQEKYIIQEKDIKQEEDIKQEKDIKKEEYGTGTATYLIRSAISHLPLTESAHNIPADTQAAISTPEAGTAPSNPPAGLGNAISTTDLAAPANYDEVSPAMDGLSVPANNLGKAVGKLSIKDAERIRLRVVTIQNPIKKEPVDMFPYQINAPSSSIFHGQNAFRKILPKPVPEVMTAPSLETTGLSGSFKVIDRVSNFVPHNNDLASKDISGAFDMAYEDACKLPGFWEQPMWNGVEVYRMSPLTLAQHYAAHKANEASHAKTFVFTPTRPVFQAPSAANIPAPVFQAPTRAYNPAPVFQAQSGANYQAPHFQGQTGAHYQAPHYQAPHYQAPHFHARNGAYHPIPHFHGRTGVHNSAPTFHGVNYPAPNTAPLSQANFHAGNYTTPHAALGFQARSPVSIFASSTAPGFHPPPPVPRYASVFQDPNHIHLNYLADIPAPPIFINLTAADFQKMEMLDSLAVPKIREGPRIKIEQDEDVKFEPERCYSDSVLARKRARDVDSEDEELGLERPWKFSG
ncbi:hypothetical protein VE02_08743 [Pseudogymnoascus sp. 03VT05]|nr:hypothetical protein VE02_08743 [Pseudogymnoascus sp. 03VT05]